MTNLINRFKNDESGATAIEYGLICAFVSLVIITALGFVGQDLQTIWEDISAALKTASGRV